MISQLGERFASKEEIKQYGTEINLSAGDIKSCGLPLMVDSNNIVVDDSERHSLIIGSTGSGKTRRLIMPALQIAALKGENIVATDVKGELYERMGHMLTKLDYSIHVINFRDLTRSAGWNPLLAVHKAFHVEKNDDKGRSIAADIAAALSRPHEECTNDLFWNSTSKMLLTTLIVILGKYGTKEECNFATLARWCCSDSVDALIELSKNLPLDSPEAINLKALVASTPERTRQSIIVSLYAIMIDFLSMKQLTKVLSDSTFDFEDLCRDKKTALFIITPDEKPTFKALIAQLINDLYATFISYASKYPNQRLETRQNLFLDEFNNIIGTIPGFPSMISAARSRNIRMFIVSQGIAQIEENYGSDAQTIIGNCNIYYLLSYEQKLLEMLSNLVGNRYLSDGRSIPLITVPQLQRLKQGEALILLARQRPFITDSLKDIDEYDALKYPLSPPPPVVEHMEPRILSVITLLDDIQIGERLDFCENRKSNSEAIENNINRFGGDYDELKETLEKHFNELFASADE